MFNRPNWDQTYMDMCNVLVKRSTCLRLQTASIIVKNNVIVSVGYNGTPPGKRHCCEYWFTTYKESKEWSDIPTFKEFLSTSFFYDAHHNWSNINEIHGEMNAILFAGRNGIPIYDATMYTIYSPCINCAKSILVAGITRVVYQFVYKRSTEGIDFLKNCGICIIQLE